MRALVQRGTIRPQDRVIAVLTGHLLKDPAGGEVDVNAAPEPPLTPDDALAMVERVLAQATESSQP